VKCYNHELLNSINSENKWRIVPDTGAAEPGDGLGGLGDTLGQHGECLLQHHLQVTSDVGVTWGHTSVDRTTAVAQCWPGEREVKSIYKTSFLS